MIRLPLPPASLPCLLLLALMAPHGFVPISLAQDQPNILFIITDDQSYETLGNLGALDIETPNLDRLAKQGTSFSHCYNMGSWSGAVCIASRTMLNTGRFLWTANQVQGNLGTELEQGRLWPDMIRKAGYRTYLTGKWHVNVDASNVFDVTRHVRPGMPAQTAAGYDRPPANGVDPWSPWDKDRGGFWAGGQHWSEVVADDTVDFIDEARQLDQPFFLYVAFNAPHDPRQSPKEFVDRYPPDRVDVPVNFLPEYPFKDKIGCSATLRDEKLAPFPRSEYAIKVHRGEYYACITHLDLQIGRILNSLEKNGLSDNTWIVLTSDHGLAVGHHGLVGKQNMYDHSVRVPFIVVGPGVEPDRTINTPIYLQDVVPTTLELAGINIPEHVEFKSLIPLLQDTPVVDHHQPIIGAYLNQQRMVTDGEWKLIVYPDVPMVRLYHLATDPAETKDVAATPQHKDQVRRLMASLIQWQKHHNDPLDLSRVFPQWLP